MHNLIAAILGVLVIFPCVAVEPNSIVGVWSTDEVLSQVGPSVTTYSFGTNGAFGPHMYLAQQLLEKNEQEAVVRYLDLVAQFWAHASNEYLHKAEEKTPGASAILKDLNKEHQKQIELWKQEILAGDKPTLNLSNSLE